MGSFLNHEEVVAAEEFLREANDLSRFDCFLFDLDDTLYPRNSGLQDACRQNIEEFMVEKLGVDESVVGDLCNHLYKSHGTTMAGLQATGFEFDFDEFHNYVHGRLPYERLHPDHKLRDLLLSLPQKKIIFTNADKLHALRVLSKLELQDCFEDIISFETIMEHPGFELSIIQSESECRTNHLPQVICKPSLEAMRRAIDIAKVDPCRTLFFDDSVHNIVAGKNAGLHTVLVGSTTRYAGADYAIHSIHEVIESVGGMVEEDYAKYRQEILAN
ncbi:hypothetical protein O6H91_13G028100 [Diphasiastrum complanatum]|uniref:Uncharacterized protein n=1 Tax=Diphasiastrum complanatum TaxID=34168 RepID=A0ACC2BT94_DIPCM|nr:hypothetical protein O6H91_Y438600 [Diphasiastrum complanatum]KAJ7532983.1 hypothetical protein O6H91_13G028100 [Diphasiastrum complanatum]